nr:MAG TPA: hypothetical protein [Caudoviricetes sp.]
MGNEKRGVGLRNTSSFAVCPRSKTAIIYYI